jgi:hypothetical protein
MQPCWQRLPSTNTPGPLYQSEEHRLERILGIGVMRKQLTTHGPHEWAMPTDEFLERRLVPGSDELRK